MSECAGQKISGEAMSERRSRSNTLLVLIPSFATEHDRRGGGSDRWTDGGRDRGQMPLPNPRKERRAVHSVVEVLQLAIDLHLLKQAQY